MFAGVQSKLPQEIQPATGARLPRRVSQTLQGHRGPLLSGPQETHPARPGTVARGRTPAKPATMPLKGSFTPRKRESDIYFLWSLLLFNVNIKFDFSVNIKFDSL